MSTAACLLLDPATGELVYSRAGHPPPLVADQNGTTFLDDGLGPALGLPGGGARPEAVTTVPAGASLLLFTDGLIEARGADLDDGLRRLAAAVSARASTPLDALVDGVLGALADPAGVDDDIAMVAVRPLPTPLVLRLPADPARLGEVRRAVAAWAVGAALSVDATEDLQLAVGEAVANAVEHAYRDDDRAGPVEAELTCDRDGRVTVTVRDAGAWRPVPDDPGFRGRGLQMIDALTGDVDIDHGPGGTVVRFCLSPTAVPGPRSVPTGREPTPATLTVTDAGDRRCLELAGDLDLAGVGTVRGALLAELAGDRQVVLDLTKLGYVTSVGAALLLQGMQAAGNGLEVLLPAGGPARRMLDLAGLGSALRGAAPLRPR